MEVTVSIEAEGKINKDVRLNKWRISPVVSEIVP